MKKKILCVLFAVLLCASVCACGSERTDRGNQSGDMDILPDVSPMLSPDRQDGVVTDGDGFIGNGGQTGADQTVSPSPTAGLNPMPSASPSAGTGTDMSGANPSASPKP